METIKQDILGRFSARSSQSLGQVGMASATCVNMPKSSKTLELKGRWNNAANLQSCIIFWNPLRHLYEQASRHTPASKKRSTPQCRTSWTTLPVVHFQTMHSTSRMCLCCVGASRNQPPNVSMSAGWTSITWNNNSGQGDAHPTDVAIPLVFNTDKGEAVCSTFRRANLLCHSN